MQNINDQSPLTPIGRCRELRIPLCHPSLLLADAGPTWYPSLLSAQAGLLSASNASFEAVCVTHFILAPGARGREGRSPGPGTISARSARSADVCQSGVSSQRGIKIGHFGDLGPSCGLDGGPESQNYPNDIQNDFHDAQIRPKRALGGSIY